MGNYSSFYKGTYGNAVPKQTPKYFDNACSSSSRINLMLNDFENIYIGLYMYKCIYIYLETVSKTTPEASPHAHSQEHLRKCPIVFEYD